MKTINILRASASALILALGSSQVSASEASQESYPEFLEAYAELFLTELQHCYLFSHRAGQHELEMLTARRSRLFQEGKFEEAREIVLPLIPCEVPTEESLIIHDRQDKLIQGILADIKKLKDDFEERVTTRENGIRDCVEKLQTLPTQEREEITAWEKMDREIEEALQKKLSTASANLQYYIGRKNAILSGERDVYLLRDDHLWEFHTIDEESLHKNLDNVQMIIDLENSICVRLNQQIAENCNAFMVRANDIHNLFARAMAFNQEEYPRLMALKPIEYPHAKIAQKEVQLEFVQKNAFFLSPTPRPKAMIHGFPDNLSGSAGEGIIIGILDFFPKHLASTPNKLTYPGKVINLNFNGSEKPTEESSLHGICVASIAASSEIGQAPGAQVEYLDHEGINAFGGRLSEFGFGDDICQNKTRLEAHVNFLDRLPKFEKNNPYPIEQVNVTYISDKAPQLFDECRNINKSPILQTQARVVNMSLGSDGYRIFSDEIELNELDTDLGSFIHHRVLADLDILCVVTIGNNGMYLPTSTGYLFKKALVKAKTTKSHSILVGDLLEDGLTISKFSNQPGDDHDFQKHTIFAQGTNVPCLSLQTNDYIEESGTSFAAPQVSGAAAIVMSQFPTLSAKQVSKCLRKGATPILLGKDGFPYSANTGLPYELTDCDAGTALAQHPELEAEINLSRTKYGMGRLNIGRALERAKEMFEGL